MENETTIINNNTEGVKVYSSKAIITTHYLFSSFPKEFIDNDVLKIVHLDCFHPDDIVVQSALELLKKIGTEKSHQYLFAIIKDYPDERKILALETLYHIGNQSIVTSLLDYFKVSFDEKIKSYVLKVIAHFSKGSKEVEDLILAHSKDELHESPLRFAAISALSDLGDTDALKNVIESKNENIIIAGIQSLSKIKHIDSIHLIKRMGAQFKRYSTNIKMALIRAFIELENDYVLELIKIILQEEDTGDEEIKNVLDIIVESEYLRKYPIRLTKSILRIKECSDELEEKIISCFTNYYESFPEVDSKISQEIAESIEGNLRSYFSKFKVNYEKEYKANLSLKTKLEQNLFYAKEFLEKFSTAEFVQTISNYLRNESFSSSNSHYIKLKNEIDELSSHVRGDYSVNVNALLKILQSADKLERTRVAAYLNTVDFKKKAHINRLHRLLSFVSITKNIKCMDVSYEIFKWGFQLQDRKIIKTSILALGRSGHKVLIREAEKTIFPMEDKKLHLVTLMALGELANKESIPVIVQYFTTNSYDEDVYLSIVNALKSIGIKNDRSTLETLLKIFITSPSDIVKYNAAITFASLASGKMIPTLAKYKDSKSDKIRELLPLMVGKLYESDTESGKEMVQNFYYSMLKDSSLYVKINAIIAIYRLGDSYAIEVLKDLFKTTDFKILSDIIVKTVEIDSLDKIYWLVNLLKFEDESIQRSVSLALVSLLEGDSKFKKTIADLTKDFRLKPFGNKKIEEINSIKATQLDLSKLQEKEKFQFERENTKEMSILFVDITGYTKKSSTMSLIEVMTYLNTYEEMALPIFKAHYGTVVKKMGDGLMLSFPLAIYAALAGIRLQEKLANYNLFKPDKEKIITRVGINSGSVAIQGKDLFGDTVNVASRMETKARPGCVLASESTFNQVKDYVTYEDMGPTTVKGKDEPINTFHLLSISASLPDKLDPLISGDSATQITINTSQPELNDEIEKIKALITLDGTNKSELTKKLLLNYRILYKSLGQVKDPETKEILGSILVNQWQELKTKFLKE
ncbi:MAG: hypothetical protein OEV44_02205 [Spirochaetota bacterium]|nr:hypothetical protein [Spirochaetota bacterium]